MTTVDHTRHDDHHAPTGHASPDDIHVHKPTSFYVKVAVALAIVTAIEVGLYWHFVDIVWIVIFTLVYLIPA